ncbi:unnamed protein product [Nesidiocoris tenuis]|uniref:Uncharacterized protein n=1 Tax=Nesidiocoris tenuis TaxID=355587 RepID=A0A6H5GF20_9HEMI|nr:unnamed protein product [Nesidiocoris tenuis]
MFCDSLNNFGQKPNSSGSMGHFNGDSPYLRRECRYSGISGIVRKGLTHLAIPDGWNWGGPVSLHCPVWAQVNPLPTSASSINIGKDC